MSNWSDRFKRLKSAWLGYQELDDIQYQNLFNSVDHLATNNKSINEIETRLNGAVATAKTLSSIDKGRQVELELPNQRLIVERDQDGFIKLISN